jgi:hypothetical protein
MDTMLRRQEQFPAVQSLRPGITSPESPSAITIIFALPVITRRVGQLRAPRALLRRASGQRSAISPRGSPPRCLAAIPVHLQLNSLLPSPVLIQQKVHLRSLHRYLLKIPALTRLGNRPCAQRWFPLLYLLANQVPDPHWVPQDNPARSQRPSHLRYRQRLQVARHQVPQRQRH